MTLPAPVPNRLAARWEERVMRAAHPVAYPLLSAVRRPVLRVPGLGVLVTDASLLRSVLMNTAGFTKTGPGSPSDLWTPVLGPSVLLNMEGADHLALRRRLGPLFAPSYVEPLAAASLPTAALTARLRAGERVDIVEVAKQFAGVMIAHLVGVSAVDADLFERVSSITRVVRLSRPTLSPSQVRDARSVLAELAVHARSAYAAGDEATVPGRMRALGLTESEAMGAVGAFVLTGTETLVSYIPRLVALLVDSGWFPLIAADRALVEPAITEGLRVTTPSPVMLRSVSPSSPPDATIGNVRVRAGDRVILATFAANRALGPFDPAANVASTLKQLWFGAGTHFCLGAPLALAQIRLTLDAILDGAGTSALTVTSRLPARGVLIPSYAALVVRTS